MRVPLLQAAVMSGLLTLGCGNQTRQLLGKCSANCKGLFEWNDQGSIVGEKQSQDKSLVF